MPFKLMNTAIRAAKPREKRCKLADGEGLYVEAAPAGGQVVAHQVPLRRQGEMTFPGLYPGFFIFVVLKGMCRPNR